MIAVPVRLSLSRDGEREPAPSESRSEATITRIKGCIMLPGRPPKPGSLAAWAQGPAQASIQKHSANVEPARLVRQTGCDLKRRTGSRANSRADRRVRPGMGPRHALPSGEQVDKRLGSRRFCLAPWRQTRLRPSYEPHPQRANEADGQLAGSGQHSLSRWEWLPLLRLPFSAIPTCLSRHGICSSVPSFGF